MDSRAAEIPIERIAADRPLAVRGAFGSARRLGGLATFARRKPLGVLGAALIALVVLMALFADTIAPADPLFAYKGYSMAAPGTRTADGLVMLLGGDELGRDLFSRVVHGARISLWIGFVSVGIGIALGTLLGVVSGYWGGLWDLLLQRIVDSLMAIPVLILAMTIVAVLGSGTNNAILAIVLVLVPGTARVVRGLVLSVKEETYIEAARTVGCRAGRIIGRHILPNVAHAVIVLTAIYLGNAILIGASLSFLGLGTPTPQPDWGVMISGAGRQYMTLKPILLLAPGLALSLTIFGFNMLGDALRDYWDPRLRSS